MSVLRTGECFILDSLPVPVCKRVRASRCRKVCGRDYCGYCAAKREKFFGWRLHLICTPDGLPVRFELLPAAYHDLTPIHELTVNLPAGAAVYGDKAYHSADDERSIWAETGVRLVPIRRANMTPYPWADDYDLRLYRHSIETRNSQLEAMGLQALHARTHAGFEIKVFASVLALACLNLKLAIRV
jgi:IS5 family transposase